MRGGGNAYRSTVSSSLFSYFPLGFVLAPKRILATTPFLSGISETPTGSIMINGLRWMEILPLSLSLSLFLCACFKVDRRIFTGEILLFVGKDGGGEQGTMGGVNGPMLFTT